jgi:hypothetical protein
MISNTNIIPTSTGNLNPTIIQSTNINLLRTKSGYNVFMRIMMTKLKEENTTEGRERLKIVGERWMKLTNDERDKYNAIDEEENLVEGLVPQQIPLKNNNNDSNSESNSESNSDSDSDGNPPTTNITILGSQSKSGYNVFMGLMMKKLIEENKTEAREKLRLVGHMWAQLTDEEKDKYNAMAEEENIAAGRVPVKAPLQMPLQAPLMNNNNYPLRFQPTKNTTNFGGLRGKTGYNVFMGIMMKKLKEENTTEGRERLKIVGQMWVQLTQEEKDKYNAMAEEENKTTDRVSPGIPLRNNNDSDDE